MPLLAFVLPKSVLWRRLCWAVGEEKVEASVWHPRGSRCWGCFRRRRILEHSLRLGGKEKFSGSLGCGHQWLAPEDNYMEVAGSQEKRTPRVPQGGWTWHPVHSALTVNLEQRRCSPLCDFVNLDNTVLVMDHGSESHSWMVSTVPGPWECCQPSGRKVHSSCDSS